MDKNVLAARYGGRKHMLDAVTGQFCLLFQEALRADHFIRRVCAHAYMLWKTEDMNGLEAAQVGREYHRAFRFRRLSAKGRPV